VAADVYAHPMHVGRGGWSWYTGSAGWMYQAAVQSILGLLRRGTTFSVNPCIPSVWPEYSVDWTVGRTRFHVRVLNPEHRSHGVKAAELEGTAVSPGAIPFDDDGGRHEIPIVLGDPPLDVNEIAAGAGVTDRS
jgi:cyclic beta-1,2-glucan synthetase